MEAVITHDVAERFRRFATHEAAGVSDVFAAWATGVADDPEVAALIGALPARERQPNLVFALARMVSPDLVEASQAHARPDEYARLRRVVLDHWDVITSLTATHYTQTNEAARMAVLLPALHTIHRACGKPLALVELGASAGLVLHPQAWNITYHDPTGLTLSRVAVAEQSASLVAPSPAAGDLTVTIADSSVTPPTTLPPIDWRIGVDLNPLDVRRPEVVQWLRTLVWPGQTHRLTRLDAAIAVAQADPVVILPRDITRPETLDEVLALIPTDVHPVVFHCAVQAYLDADHRAALSQRLLERASSGSITWLSYEGTAVIDLISETIDDQMRARTQPGDFVVAIDGQAQYLADGHAHVIR